jgi:hypothetical protein
MAPAASAANTKSMKAHCTQADGSKPPPGPDERTEPKIEAITPPVQQLRHTTRLSSNDSSGRGGSGRGGTRERCTHNGVPLSLGASLALSRQKRDDANKKAQDREASYDALGSDEDDEIMREMMDLSDTDDEEDKPVTQKKRKHKNRYSPLSDDKDEEDSETSYTMDSSITNSTGPAKDTIPLSILNKKSPAKKGKKFIAFSDNSDKEQQEWQNTKTTSKLITQKALNKKSHKETKLHRQTASQQATEAQATEPDTTPAHTPTNANPPPHAHTQKQKLKSNQTTIRSFINNTTSFHQHIIPPPTHLNPQPTNTQTSPQLPKVPQTKRTRHTQRNP